jgi:hypothetical protein
MKKIVFSLTCHESYECVEDLIINIKYFSRFFKCIILISLTETIKNNFNKYILNDDVYIVNIRPNNSNIWGKIDLFHQHILNHTFSLKNNIGYDYFWFVASNEYFIKDITEDFLEKNVLKKNIFNKTYKEDYNTYYQNFVHSQQEWTWYKDLKKDEYTMIFFKNQKIYLSNIQHEGIVLDFFFMNELYNFYMMSKINEKSSFRNYCLEEIIISSYIQTRYPEIEIKQFCYMFLNNSLLTYNNDYEKIYNNLLNDDLTLSIKGVKRIYNDDFRRFLRDKMNNKKNNFILNQYKFENEMKYYSHNNKCSLCLTNNIISFIKFHKGSFHYAWFGYNLESMGNYKITFDIETNKNITNFLFIKTHHPERLYKINQNIHQDNWNYVELIVHVNSSDLLVFIFDNYIDEISIKIKNLTIYIL